MVGRGDRASASRQMRVDNPKQEEAVREIEVCQLGEKIAQFRLHAVAGGVIKLDWNQKVPIVGLPAARHAGDQKLALVGWLALKQRAVALLQEIRTRVTGADSLSLLVGFHVNDWRWCGLLHADTQRNGESGALCFLQREGEFTFAQVFGLGEGKKPFNGLVLVQSDESHGYLLC